MKKRNKVAIAFLVGVFLLNLAGPTRGAEGPQGDSRPFVSACEPPELGFQQNLQAPPVPPGICQLIGVVDPSGETFAAVYIDPGYVTSCVGGACTVAVPFTAAPILGTTVAAAAGIGAAGAVGIGTAAAAVGVGIGVGVGTGTSPVQSPSQ